MEDPQPTTTPLTPEQRAWLKTNTAFPVGVFGVILVGNLLLGACLIKPFLDKPFAKIAIGTGGLLLIGACIAVGLHVWNNSADLRLGVAQIRTARLIKKHATSHAPRTFYAEFEAIGTLIVQNDDYQILTDNAAYHITYSPHIKWAWQVEPLA